MMLIRVAKLHTSLTISRFVDDIPRWASLLSLDEQPLFFEIASHLWRFPLEFVCQEQRVTFDREEALVMLQTLVNNLVNTSGLFENWSGRLGGSYRLQTLRQRHLQATNASNTDEERIPLDSWRPSPKPEVAGDLHSNDPKPPDPEEKHFSILARITVLVAGAIFGAILLYLCRRSFRSTPSFLTLTSK